MWAFKRDFRCNLVTPTGRFGWAHAAVFRQRLAAEEGLHRHEFAAVARAEDELNQRRIGMGEAKVIAGRSAHVRNDVDAVGLRHLRRAVGLGDAAAPGEIGLQDVCATALDELVEAKPRVFMLAGGDARPGDATAQFGVGRRNHRAEALPRSSTRCTDGDARPFGACR